MHRLPLVLLLLCPLALLPSCGKDSGGGEKSGKVTEKNGKVAAKSEKDTEKSGKAEVSGTLDVPKSAGTPADAPRNGLGDALEKRVAAALQKGRTFLLGQQEDSGGFTDRGAEGMQANVSFTAMAVAGLVAATPKTGVEQDEAIEKGLTFLVGFQKENGSIVDDPRWTNYCTSAAISALAVARVGKHAKAHAKARAYLEASQIQDESREGSFGGFPYKDAKQTADGSNAFMAVNALEAAGLPADSPVRKRLERFVSGLQNRTESNTRETKVEMENGETRTVVASDDGGAYYRVGESKAGMVKRADGKWELRSYGSMTYAALRMMLFAGVKPDDPRVVGLVHWISTNWTVDRNPGFEDAPDAEVAGQQGYFYFLYSAARALAAYERAQGKPLVVHDAQGREHNWRYEIAQSLLARQNEDGSWRNAVDRWMEGMKTLATAFSMQTLGILTGRLD